MRKRRWLAAGGLLVLLGAGIAADRLGPISFWKAEEGDYPMRPVSVLAEDGRSDIQYLARGQQASWKVGPGEELPNVGEETQWKTAPGEEVKVCPKLESSRPLHGVVQFGSSPSGTQAAVRLHFVVDESGGTGAGYDRLYLDADGDSDLTNDDVLEPMENPPRPSHPWHNWGQNVVFQPLAIPLDFGPHLGTRPVEILPRLSLGHRWLAMFFVATEARKGKIQIGRRRFHAVLAQSQCISGRYDSPFTELYLTTAGFRRVRDRWWGADRLSAFRLVDGRFYTISAAPTGEVLTVRRYRGDLGVFKVGPGGRPIDDVKMSGSLCSADRAVPVGAFSFARRSRPDEAAECELPVGDYQLTRLCVRYGRLRITMANNYHADGERRATLDPRVYGIKIRKDRPYVLDFSNRPEVMFTSPAKDEAFRRGDEINVAAVLTDPVLDTMIRGLTDVSRKVTRTVDRGGQKVTHERYLSLEPVVAISDGSGKKVAEGTMPFG